MSLAAVYSPAEAGSSDWTVKSASSGFSQLFNDALERPQYVSRRDAKRVVVLSEDDYEALNRRGSNLIDTVRSMKRDVQLADVLKPRMGYPHRTL